MKKKFKDYNIIINYQNNKIWNISNKKYNLYKNSNIQI